MVAGERMTLELTTAIQAEGLVAGKQRGIGQGWRRIHRLRAHMPARGDDGVQQNLAAQAAVAIYAAMHGKAGLAQRPRHGIPGIQAGRVLPAEPVQSAAVRIQTKKAQSRCKGKCRVACGKGNKPVRAQVSGIIAGMGRAYERCIGLHRKTSLYAFDDGLDMAMGPLIRPADTFSPRSVGRRTCGGYSAPKPASGNAISGLAPDSMAALWASVRGSMRAK